MKVQHLEISGPAMLPKEFVRPLLQELHRFQLNPRLRLAFLATASRAYHHPLHNGVAVAKRMPESCGHRHVEAVDIQGEATLRTPSDERLGDQREARTREPPRGVVEAQPLTIHQDVESIEPMHQGVRDMLLNRSAPANPVDVCPRVPASEVFAVEKDTLSCTAVLVDPRNRLVVDMHHVPRCHLADEVCVMIDALLSGVVQKSIGIAVVLEREVAAVNFFDCHILRHLRSCEGPCPNQPCRRCSD